MRLLPFLALLLAGSAHSAIVIDGTFADWSPVSTLATDPSGDTTYAPTDILEIKVDSDTSNVYFYYRTNGTIDLNTQGFRFHILIDADQNTATGYKLFGASNGGFEYMIEGATLFSYTGADGSSDFSGWGPGFIGVQSFGDTGAEAELGVPLATLGFSADDSFDMIIWNTSPTFDDDLAPDAFGSSSLTATIVPEPSTLALLTIAGLLFHRRR